MKGLGRDTLIYGAAAILSRGLALLTLPIYTRVLAPDDYGALETILVAGTLAAMLVPLEISQALARLFNEVEPGAARRRMASTALWFTVAMYAAALSGVLAIAAGAADLLLGSPAMADIIRLGGVLIAVNGIFYLLQNQLRYELRSGAYALLSSAYAILTLGLGALFGFVLDGGLIGVLLAQIIAAALSVALGLAQLRSSYALELDRHVLRDMLAFSLPLVPSALATFLTLYANRLFLNTLAGLEAVGLFAVAVRVATVVTLPLLGFQAALTPLIYAHYKSPDTPMRLARIFEAFTLIALGGCLVVGLFAAEAIAIVADPRYATAAPLVLGLALSALLSQGYIFFPGIALARKTNWQLYVFLFSAIISVGANWTLIGRFGVAGAAAATVGSGIVFMSVWIAASQRLYPLPIRWCRLALPAAIFAIGGVWAAWVPDAALSGGVRAGLLALFAVSAAVSGIVDRVALRSGVARATGLFRERG